MTPQEAAVLIRVLRWRAATGDWPTLRTVKDWRKKAEVKALLARGLLARCPGASRAWAVVLEARLGCGGKIGSDDSPPPTENPETP